jgi:hypothetical protein
MTSPFRSEDPLVVPARAPEPPRRLLPAADDVIAIAHIAQAVTGRAVIPYWYGEARRRMRIFPGGWTDFEVHDDEDDQGARP